MNHVCLAGNLVADPELRYSAGGKAWCVFRVAVNRKQGDELVASFFDGKVFGEQAERFAESAGKGVRVLVSGRLELEQWEGEGGKRSRVVVLVDEVGVSLRWGVKEPF